MTMPHLMNCDHSEDGWCLDCVKSLHDRAERWYEQRNEAYSVTYAAGEYMAKRISKSQFFQVVKAFEQRETRGSMSAVRTYQAWAVYMQIADQEPCMGYKSIGGKLPFFTTKKDAQAFVADHSVKRPRAIKLTVRKVWIEMHEQAPTP